MPEHSDEEAVEGSGLEERLMAELAAEQPTKGWRPFG
jgi:hypothetical protein